MLGGFVTGATVRAAGFAVVATLFGCSWIPPETSDVRVRRYLGAYPSTSREVAEAMAHRHVLPEMTEEQVLASLGEPAHRTRFEKKRSAVWLYPAGKLQQRDSRAHGAALFRIAFVDGRVAAIDPL